MIFSWCATDKDQVAKQHSSETAFHIKVDKNDIPIFYYYLAYLLSQ